MKNDAAKKDLEKKVKEFFSSVGARTEADFQRFWGSLNEEELSDPRLDPYSPAYDDGYRSAKTALEIMTKSEQESFERMMDKLPAVDREITYRVACKIAHEQHGQLGDYVKRRFAKYTKHQVMKK